MKANQKDRGPGESAANLGLTKSPNPELKAALQPTST